MKKSVLPLAFAASFLALASAGAEENQPTPRVMVTGEGQVAVSPDMALMTLSVLREADTAREALDANNEAMAAVIAAMKEDGVEGRDLQTSGLSISPRWVHPGKDNGEEKPRIVGYQVTNTLTVRIRDLDKVGSVLDRSVTLGVNQGGGISFTNDDPKEAVGEARAKAMKDAIAKATTLAEAAGAKLGKIIEISEHSYQRPPMPLQVKAMRMEMAGDAAPVEAGENTYQVQVNVTFGLDQ